MTTPHHLAATAAAWSLQEARRRLAQLARDEVRLADAGLLAAASALRSPTYGTRHSSGDHGDPTGQWAGTREPRITTWADLLDRLDHRLRWLGDTLRCPDGPALGRILTALPTLQPGTARVVAAHLADEDAWVRAACRMPAATTPLPGVECPHCGERQLQVLCAGPVDAWVVVCATGRPCTGQGCRCGMPGAVEGAPHIWPRARVLGAVAGVVPKRNPRTGKRDRHDRPAHR
ncbi:hypothetical protein E1091_12950 [Micromonospora fluostatini]|uniref:Transposase n=1 Tax=Micromonospora fluostatini TaxID=1629071 RepID=A0ABY2DK65_9ACTN|nr:hypothetical protein E1091_12950 [Micromonospora fluostatini]